MSIVEEKEILDVLLSWKNAVSFTESFVDEFYEFFRPLTSNEEPQQPDPWSLIDNPVFPIRYRGIDLLTASEIKGENEYAPINPDDDTYYLEILTRQGGGNRESWGDGDDEIVENNTALMNHPNYVWDTDDWFDHTYASFYFKVDEEKAKAYVEQVALLDRFAFLKNLFHAISNGILPPWIISHPEEAKNLINKGVPTSKELETVTVRLKTQQERLDGITQRITELEHADYDTVVAIAKETHSEQEYPILIQREHDLRNYQRMLTEAESLPTDSALRAWLLTDRGEGSYTYTDKVRGRKVQKTVVYQKESILGAEVTKASKNLENSLKSLRRELISDFKKELTDAHKTINKITGEHQNLVAKLSDLWVQGWEQGTPVKDSQAIVDRFTKTFDWNPNRETHG